MNRYGSSMVVVCIGGTLMGFTLAATLVLDRKLVPGPPAASELIFVSLFSGLVGSMFGLVLGLAEGLILAFTLAGILGLLKDRVVDDPRQVAEVEGEP